LACNESEWLPDGGFNWGVVSETLADLLIYPTAEYPAKVQAFLRMFDPTTKEARLMSAFAGRIASLSTEQLQRIYRDTFELTPSCSLEIGKQLHPSDKDKQDEFTAWMRMELTSKNVKTVPNTADNLIHRQELVHRDLKPSNMFLTQNGVKIIDFGLARLWRADPTITQTQLITPGQFGALIWSKTSQLALRDIFQLQDDLVNRIVESLSLPLTAREHRRLKHDVPASPTAYEYYLRGNLLYYDWAKMSVARDLYLRCVEEDPQYAPAWARLGRCHRLIAKWSGEPEEDLVRAKNALARALQLSPDLPVAHHLHALLEADLGHAQDAMVLLLGRAGVGSNDPELFAGLTQVCRYCGLLEASLAAHKQARRLDPQIRTSVAHTHFMLGDYGAVPANSSGGDHFGVHPLALSHLGREREALELLRKGLQEQLPFPVIRWVGTSILALLEGRPEESVQQSELFVRSCRDPEGFYYFARQFAYLGKHTRTLELLTEAAKLGYVCFPTMARDPWLDPLRGNPEFTVVRRAAETRYREAAQAFLAAAGGRILGVRPT
jgi:tetratricopeptide (TPR) repeat protein